MKDLLIVIFSTLLGAILQKRNASRILWLRKNERLITPNIENSAIKIYYKTKVIKGLSIAKILIINDSQTALTQNAFANGKGIIIKGQGNCRLLRIDISEHTDTGNNYSTCIDKNRKQAFVKFHHFNPEDAFLIQIFHTGKQASDLECNCSATGVTKTKRISIIGHTLCDIIITTTLQIMLCMALFGLSLSWIEHGGIRFWLGIALLFLIVLVIMILIASWEIEYRFKGWYKFAKKNGF